ncbi:hypothetical protein J4G08_21305 [Candidatus Poribacteria bacterium]|nr:hypothetical protein [Candidatus Poribacteria bacterium]
MHVEFLLEERSAEEVLKSILPKIISDDVSFSCHVFEGKDDLLKQLPMRLKGYRLWIPDDYRKLRFVSVVGNRSSLLQRGCSVGAISESRPLPAKFR